MKCDCEAFSDVRKTFLDKTFSYIPTTMTFCECTFIRKFMNQSFLFENIVSMHFDKIYKCKYMDCTSCLNVSFVWVNIELNWSETADVCQLNGTKHGSDLATVGSYLHLLIENYLLQWH